MSDQLTQPPSPAQRIEAAIESTRTIHNQGAVDAALAAVRDAIREMEEAHKDAMSKEGQRALNFQKAYIDASRFFTTWATNLKANVNGLAKCLKRERNVSAGLRVGKRELETEVKALKAERARAVAAMEALRGNIDYNTGPHNILDACLQALKGDQA